jgi:hypothetical protein
MRRVAVVFVLGLVVGVWPAASGVTHGATATQAAPPRSLQADFNGDGADDLAIGVPFENVGSVVAAGAVNVLYGSAVGGLSGIDSDLFTQDTAGVGSAAEEGDVFGFALATGDFNGDTFADLAVGVPGESVGSVVAGGAVNVLYGSADGLSGIGSDLFTQVGSAAETDDTFGFALAAGDFNTDTFADLAAGAPFENAGSIVDAGAVSVLPGSATGLTTTGGRLFTQDSPGVGSAAESGDLFGFSLAAGDFNTDTFADLAIGAPFEDTGPSLVDAGAVNVLYGSATGLTGSGSQLFTQNSPNVGSSAEVGDNFGYSLAAGDYNGNGFADLAIGAPFEDTGPGLVDAGAVNVLRGSASKLVATSQIFTQDSSGVGSAAEVGDTFGFALTAADFNNDTFADLAVGVPFEDAGPGLVDAGAVNVLVGFPGIGSVLTGAGSQLFTQDSPGVGSSAEAFDSFGFTLAAGDPGPTTASASPSGPSSRVRRTAFRR